MAVQAAAEMLVRETTQQVAQHLHLDKEQQEQQEIEMERNA
jgi:hypothetical protein